MPSQPTAHPPGDCLGQPTVRALGLIDWITFLFLHQPILPSAFWLRKPEQAGCLLKGGKDNMFLTLSLSRWGPWLWSWSSQANTSGSKEPEPNENPKPYSLLESRKLNLVSMLQPTLIQFKSPCFSCPTQKILDSGQEELTQDGKSSYWPVPNRGLKDWRCEWHSGTVEIRNQEWKLPGKRL